MSDACAHYSLVRVSPTGEEPCRWKCATCLLQVTDLASRLDGYRQALVRIVEHYHYPGGHETPAYELATKALAVEKLENKSCAE